MVGTRLAADDVNNMERMGLVNETIKPVRNIIPQTMSDVDRLFFSSVH